MEAEWQAARARDRWHDSPSAAYDGTDKYYNGMQCWTVKHGNTTYFLVINNETNHFAKKHILFAKDADAEKAKASKSERRYLEDKAKTRLEHRAIPDLETNNNRQFEKYHWTQKVSANTMLNLKPLAEGRHIDEKEAACRIAKAVAALEDLEVKSKRTVVVDFGVKCVMDAYFAKENNKIVKFRSSMNMTFEVRVKKPDVLVVEIFHADTKNLA